MPLCAIEASAAVQRKGRLLMIPREKHHSHRRDAGGASSVARLIDDHATIIRELLKNMEAGMGFKDWLCDSSVTPDFKQVV
jgi:hypothetical protein